MQRALDAAAEEVGGGDYSGAKNHRVAMPFSHDARVEHGGVGLFGPRSFSCAQCGSRLQAPLFCAICKEAAYCGADCQRAHWRAPGGHKLSCSTRKNASGGGPEPRATAIVDDASDSAAATSHLTSAESGTAKAASPAAHCETCGLAIFAAPLRCSICRGPAYCDVECQRSDWVAGHKLLCKKKVAGDAE